MDLTITIPDAIAPRVIDALAVDGGWVDVATSGPKGAFAQRHVKHLIRDVVVRREMAAAQLAAEADEAAAREAARAIRQTEEAALTQAYADRTAALEAAQAAIVAEIDLG